MSVLPRVLPMVTLKQVFRKVIGVGSVSNMGVSSRSLVLSTSSSMSTWSASERSYKDVVVTNSDGSVIVCWHPESSFPYSCTRPMPRESVSESVLKVNKVQEMDELYKYKHPRLARRDLMRLTWTTKHRWFPSRKHRYEDMRKNPRERPYL